MNEWVVSGLVTLGLIILIGVAVYLKENHLHILIGIAIGIIAVFIFVGLINMTHSLIYELLPSLREGIK